MSMSESNDRLYSLFSEGLPRPEGSPVPQEGAPVEGRSFVAAEHGERAEDPLTHPLPVPVTRRSVPGDQPRVTSAPERGPVGDKDTVELRWVFGVLYRKLWMIVLCSLLGAGGAFLANSRIVPVYSASAILMVQQAPVVGASEMAAIQTSQRLAQTYAKLITRRPVMEDAAARLGLDEIRAKVGVSLVGNTELIMLSVQHTDPVQAADTANAIAEAFIAQNKALQAERYAGPLATIEQQLPAASALIDKTQAEVDAMYVQMTQQQTKLDRLETILAGYRNTYATLQQNYEQVRLSAAQSSGYLIVAESARVPEMSSGGVYSATTTLLVQQAPVTSIGSSGTGLSGDRLALTYSQMLSGQAVLEEVIALLGLRETPERLSGRVKATLIRDTQLIRLSVGHSDPELAARIANAIAETFIAQTQALQEARLASFLSSMEQQTTEFAALIEATQSEIDAIRTELAEAQPKLDRLKEDLAGYRSDHASLQQEYEKMRPAATQPVDNVIIVETAQPPERPAPLHTSQYVMLGAAVGAMAALGLAFLLEHLDDRIRTPDDVGGMLGLATLGAIGRLAKEQDRLVVVAQPLSPAAEAYRVLCTNMRFGSTDGNPLALLVTSPDVGEGKSITLANLAAVVAQAGLRVVAIDGDLRRPRLGQLFGLDPDEEAAPERSQGGFRGALLAGRIDGRLQPTGVDGLTVLPSGDPPLDPAAMMDFRHIRALLHELAGRADVVLIDSPPVLAVADATALAQEVDAVLLVLDACRTRRQVAQHAAARLSQAGANLVGVVLNRVPAHASSDAYAYSAYHAYHENGRGRKQHRRWPFGKKRETDTQISPDDNHR